MPYTMHIETKEHGVRQHPYHLGTEETLAKNLVFERLRNDPAAVTIALRYDGELVQVFDRDDLPENEAYLKWEDTRDERLRTVM